MNLHYTGTVEVRTGMIHGTDLPDGTYTATIHLHQPDDGPGWTQLRLW